MQWKYENIQADKQESQGSSYLWGGKEKKGIGHSTYKYICSVLFINLAW